MPVADGSSPDDIADPKLQASVPHPTSGRALLAREKLRLFDLTEVFGAHQGPGLPLACELQQPVESGVGE